MTIKNGEEMRTKEFTEQLFQLGYGFETKVGNEYLFVIDDMGFNIARVSTTRKNVVDVLWEVPISNNLYDLLRIYACTPINKRKD